MSKEKEFVDMLNKEMNELKTVSVHYTEHLEQENAQLKQQLTEKDKEIEEYAESLSYTMEKISNLELEITKKDEELLEAKNIIKEMCQNKHF